MPTTKVRKPMNDRLRESIRVPVSKEQKRRFLASARRAKRASLADWLRSVAESEAERLGI